MNSIFRLFGIVIMLLGIVVGIWVAVWWGWVGGIVAVIEAAKLTPVDAWGVATGIVRVLFANFLGVCTGWIIVSLGAGMTALGSKHSILKRKW